MDPIKILIGKIIGRAQITVTKISLLLICVLLQSYKLLFIFFKFMFSDLVILLYKCNSIFVYLWLSVTKFIVHLPFGLSHILVFKSWIPFCAAAYAEMGFIANAIGISGGDSIIRPALAFYTVSFFTCNFHSRWIICLCNDQLFEVLLLLKIALERNFTRGRRKEQVAAACLYIACRYEIPFKKLSLQPDRITDSSSQNFEFGWDIRTLREVRLMDDGHLEHTIMILCYFVFLFSHIVQIRRERKEHEKAGVLE